MKSHKFSYDNNYFEAVESIARKLGIEEGTGLDYVFELTVLREKTITREKKRMYGRLWGYMNYLDNILKGENYDNFTHTKPSSQYFLKLQYESYKKYKKFVILDEVDLLNIKIEDWEKDLKRSVTCGN